jgi:hypothetical protein
MSKHTPGPWEIWNESGGFGGAIGIFAPDDKDVPVATTCANTTPKGMQRTRNGQTRANAQLIAAAPELLAACRDALQTFEAIGKVAPRSLAAAIAKAEAA